MWYHINVAVQHDKSQLVVLIANKKTYTNSSLYKEKVKIMAEFAVVTGSLLVSMIFITATLQEIRNREVFYVAEKECRMFRCKE